MDFFKDGHFTITASNNNYIADFKQFWEEEQSKLILFKKEVKAVLTEMVEEVDKRDKARQEEEARL